MFSHKIPSPPVTRFSLHIKICAWLILDFCRRSGPVILKTGLSVSLKFFIACCISRFLLPPSDILIIETADFSFFFYYNHSVLRLQLRTSKTEEPSANILPNPAADLSLLPFFWSPSGTENTEESSRQIQARPTELSARGQAVLQSRQIQSLP